MKIPWLQSLRRLPHSAISWKNLKFQIPAPVSLKLDRQFSRGKHTYNNIRASHRSKSWLKKQSQTLKGIQALKTISWQWPQCSTHLWPMIRRSSAHWTKLSRSTCKCSQLGSCCSTTSSKLPQLQEAVLLAVFNLLWRRPLLRAKISSQQEQDHHNNSRVRVVAAFAWKVR